MASGVMDGLLSKFLASPPAEHGPPPRCGRGYHGVTFPELPKYDWKCPICHGILREPHLTTCCGNKFCHGCIYEKKRQSPRCPSCEHKNYDIAPEKLLETRLLNHKAVCDHQVRGCKWQGQLRKFEAHKRSECQYTPIKCSLGCGESILRKDTESHTKECPKRPQPCEYAKYGCQKMITPDSEEELRHNQQRKQQHLDLVKARAEEQEENLKGMEKTEWLLKNEKLEHKKIKNDLDHAQSAQSRLVWERVKWFAFSVAVYMLLYFLGCVGKWGAASLFSLLCLQLVFVYIY